MICLLKPEGVHFAKYLTIVKIIIFSRLWYVSRCPISQVFVTQKFYNFGSNNTICQDSLDYSAPTAPNASDL